MNGVSRGVSALFNTKFYAILCLNIILIISAWSLHFRPPFQELQMVYWCWFILIINQYFSTFFFLRPVFYFIMYVFGPFLKIIILETYKSTETLNFSLFCDSLATPLGVALQRSRHSHSPKTWHFPTENNPTTLSHRIVAPEFITTIRILRNNLIWLPNISQNRFIASACVRFWTR